MTKEQFYESIKKKGYTPEDLGVTISIHSVGVVNNGTTWQAVWVDEDRRMNIMTEGTEEECWEFLWGFVQMRIFMKNWRIEK